MSVFTNRAGRSTENAHAYSEAVLSLLGSREPLTVLSETPALLARAIVGLSPAELSTRETADQWAVRHVVRHLADSEIVWGWRLRLVLSHDRPAITGYDQDAWADSLRYDSSDVAQSLAEFVALRRGHLALFADLPDSSLDRVGVHAERGEESVRHMMRLYAGHDLLHLNQIARIRSAIGR